MTPCCICSRLVDDSLCPLCSEHIKLADVAGLVLAGALSDWRLSKKDPPSSPNHAAMMALASRGHGSGNWRAQLAVLMALHGIRLDDGYGGGYGE